MEIETSKGILKYKKPTVVMCFDILECITDDEGKPLSPLKSKKKLIEIVVPLIDYKSVGYKSTQEMINDSENMLAPISKIADDVYTMTISAFNKKKE
jgi:hypothetical protein